MLKTTPTSMISSSSGHQEASSLVPNDEMSLITIPDRERSSRQLPS